jgi:hypothetical protein
MAGATLETRAAVETSAAFSAPREPRFGSTPEGEVTLYVGGGAAVQPIENRLSVLRAKLV